MEKTFTMEAQVRKRVGSQESVKLREQGRIPAIVYGHKQEPQAISFDAHDFVEGLHHGHRLMDVVVDGETQTVIIKDLQYDYLGRDVIHIDLIRVDVTERIKVSVPIELKGTAQGTHEGGMIEEHVDSLDVEVVVSAIPDSLLVQIKDVCIGDSLHARDVELPEGVTLASPEDTLIVTCHMKAAAKSAEELEEAEGEAEAGDASPEVITERKEEDES
jgi:large subunit ribosomal protein L25